MIELSLTTEVAHFHDTERSNFLGNMNTAIIFLSDQISCNTGKLSLTTEVAHFHDTERSNFLGNMNTAIIFLSDQISCNTGKHSDLEFLQQVARW